MPGTSEILQRFCQNKGIKIACKITYAGFIGSNLFFQGVAPSSMTVAYFGQADSDAIYPVVVGSLITLVQISTMVYALAEGTYDTKVLNHKRLLLLKSVALFGVVAPCYPYYINSSYTAMGASSTLLHKIQLDHSELNFLKAQVTLMNFTPIVDRIAISLRDAGNYLEKAQRRPTPYIIGLVASGCGSVFFHNVVDDLFPDASSNTLYYILAWIYKIIGMGIMTLFINGGYITTAIDTISEDNFGQVSPCISVGVRFSCSGRRLCRHELLRLDFKWWQR